MKLIGCMAARNEEWCIYLSARAALRWCDELVILDHASVDRTPEIIEQVANENIGRVGVITCPDPKWDEMAHRQLMLMAARNAGATHIAIVDADEVLTGNMLPTAGGHYPFCQIPADHVLQLPLYNLRGGINRYHSNGLWGQRWVSVAFKDSPELNWQGDCFHHREPFGAALQPYRPIAQGQGGVMHLWGASERRLKAKHALYQITERMRWPKRNVDSVRRMYSLWRSAGDAGDKVPWELAEVPEAWWAPYGEMPYIPGLWLDQDPWQEKVVRSLARGCDTKGLDLFGLA